MSLVPQLDDRSFDGLLAEARALIPTYSSSEWTDHNPSDPGIAMLELFTWLAEMLIYRADQVPDRHTLAFLRLLRGPDWKPDPLGDVAAEVTAALGELRERWRAVTPTDYEQIAAGAAPAQIARVLCAPRRNLAGTAPDADASGVMSLVVLPVLEDVVQVVTAPPSGVGAVAADLPADGELLADTDASLWIGALTPFSGVRIALARPGNGYSLSAAYFRGDQWQALIPQDGTEGLTHNGTITFSTPGAWAPRPKEQPPRYWLRLSSSSKPTLAARARRVSAVMPYPTPGLAAAVRDHLEPRRILTTRVVVVGPAFVPVDIDVLVARRPGADDAAVRAEIAARIDAFLDPFTGGPQGTGWPLGRSVYLSELRELIDAVPGVDHVPDVLATTTDTAAVLLHPDGDPVGVAIGANRLPDVRVRESRIVSGVAFVSVNAMLALGVAEGASAPTVRAAIKKAMRDFFRPPSVDPASIPAKNRPVAELEIKLGEVPGVATVHVYMTTVPDRMIIDSAGAPVLSLREGELVDVTTEFAPPEA